MPQYYFECQTDKKGCGTTFCVECPISEYDERYPKSCPNCRRKKSLRQVLFPPETHIPKTLGSLAERNTREMSADQRYEMTREFNAYKEVGPSWVDTPNGIQRKIYE